MRAGRRALRGVGWTLAVFTTTSCVVSRGVDARRITVDDVRGRLRDPAKAQLIDGAIVSFPRGFRVDSGRVVGDGWRYEPSLRDSVRVASVRADSVAGMVAFRTTYDPAKTIGMSVAAAIVTFVALVAVLIATCSATQCLKDY